MIYACTIYLRFQHIYTLSKPYVSMGFRSLGPLLTLAGHKSGPQNKDKNSLVNVSSSDCFVF